MLDSLGSFSLNNKELWVEVYCKENHGAGIEPKTVDEPASVNVYTQLMQRITELMEEKQLFKVPDLKVSDIANELRTNARYVSDCIKISTSYSFTQYVNSYRIQHAKQIMRDFPDQKISTVFMDSGFTNETTFFRAFKAITGMTPKDWKSLQNDWQFLFCQSFCNFW